MINAENAGLTITMSETSFEEILNAIKDSLSDLEISDNGEDGDDKEYDQGGPEQCKLREDDHLSRHVRLRPAT